MGEVKHPEDLDLLDKYLCGDRESGEKLFGNAYPSLKRYVFSCTKGNTYLSENDKEDIISESMMRAISNQHLYNGSSKFQTFIIGYAHNVILEKHRKKAKESKNIISIEDALNVEGIDLYDNPVKIIVKKEQIDAVKEALNMLSDEQRTIIVLRVFNDMPFKLAAQLAGKSEDAVDSLFRRAIISFKNNFEKIYK
ncbi:RNA polymerase sigma factor YlaC [Ruminiclostridium hungatei]|uniref:RNA polymerase sigma factor YlaC n=1 Tax=Ruminiclostridium hungatei TaxID=48256 RepID=A0A1V4SDE9_RUMHU|nr:RNA polymerase sigma factor [Ruminiclostridium hungatei]OPX41880.1 RNA polymerase sigma factor YlaC [Ruminiclostridium hungatei]